MARECSVCSEIEGVGLDEHGPYATIIEAGEHILHRSPGFSVVPSLGPLNARHLLIVPHRHVLSLASITRPELEELQVIKDLIRVFNRGKFDVATEFFEHGTGTSGGFACSCIEHAHLHALGIEESIRELLVDEFSFKPSSYEKVCGSQALAKNGYYLFEDADGNVLLNDSQQLEQQFFRIRYAEQGQGLNAWNWRLDYNVPTLSAVIAAYSGFDDSRSKHAETQR